MDGAGAIATPPTPDVGADADVVAAGVLSASIPCVEPRRRFWPRVELALSPRAVALISIWCLNSENE